RQQPAQPLPPGVPLAVSPYRAVAATLTHRTSSSLRLGHQARTTAPGGRSCINHIPAEQRPLARCPITTASSALSYYYDHSPVSGSMLNRGGQREADCGRRASGVL